VSASGAADALSLRVGNLLVGNPETAAGLEMTLVGGVFEFESETLVAITGSDFEPRLNGGLVPLWTSFTVRGGNRLAFGATKSGARCYLCIEGGIDCPLVLGSASTHLLTTLGGIDGRALNKGDVLQTRSGPARHPALRKIKPELVEMLFSTGPLRVTPGPQADWFSSDAHALFSSSPYEVSEDSNRMGLRLLGHELQRTIDRELLTEGVSLGAVQVPQSGQPIILFVEHQTTGGYPKIANVISADMHRVGQLRPRDTVRFEFVSVDVALDLLRQQEHLVSSQSLVPA
jgi:antagonist of KipI